MPSPLGKVARRNAVTEEVKNVPIFWWFQINGMLYQPLPPQCAHWGTLPKGKGLGSPNCNLKMPYKTKKTIRMDNVT